MSAEAATKAEQLNERMQALARQDNVSEFEIANLRREAKSIEQEFPVAAFMAFGLLAAIEGRADEVYENYRKALRISPNAIVYSNFSTSLNWLGLYSDALKHVQEAHRLEPSDLIILDNLINCAVHVGVFHQAEKYLDERARLHPKTPHLHESFIRSAVEVMEANGVSDEQVQMIQELTEQVLRANGTRSTRVEFLEMEDEDSRWVSAWIELPLPVERVVDLNFKLADRLAALEPPSPAASCVNYMFVSAET